MWPKPRPDIVRKTGTRQRRSSGPEKVELARAYAQTNSEARYTTAGSFSTVRRQKKVKPRIRPDRGQKIAIRPCSITPFPALVAGTYPSYRLGHRCRWTEIARQPKLSSGVETYLLSACAATSYLLTLGMSFCSRSRRSTSSHDAPCRVRVCTLLDHGFELGHARRFHGRHLALFAVGFPRPLCFQRRAALPCMTAASACVFRGFAFALGLAM